jgi:hypothetical protein
MKVYRKYVQHNNISTIYVDSTGSLIKKRTVISKNKSKNILFYQIAI